jgi:hypothetical protein
MYAGDRENRNFIDAFQTELESLASLQKRETADLKTQTTTVL